MTNSPFHSGEIAAQQRTGSFERVSGYAREMIRPFMPAQHREFYEQLPFVVVTARDGQGRPWTTLLAGRPGFIEAEGDRVLNIAAEAPSSDALTGAITTDSEIGVLGIELDTRRRNRVNGRVIADNKGTFRFEARQSFGNCPQFITGRQWLAAPKTSTPVESRIDSALSAAQVDWISGADTFFIGSGVSARDSNGELKDHEALGMDASHRGGSAGFVEVLDHNTLVFPDYAGNNHFNTIGNLLEDPRVALLFVEFDRGDLLQITGTARIDWNSPEVARRAGAQRLVYVDIESTLEQRGMLPIRWQNPQRETLSLRLTERVEESSEITSFLFENVSGASLPDYRAGQHLPITISPDEASGSVRRSYSLSGNPVASAYRISVKREPQGLVSRLLHDSLAVGDRVTADRPAGDFVVNGGDQPLVLISAGVGITPMVSILHELVESQSKRRVVFVHGARSGAHFAFSSEIRELLAKLPNARARLFFSQPAATDRQGRDFDVEGRVTAGALRDLLTELSAAPGADYYLCGPSEMVSNVVAEVSASGVREAAIHFETFG